MPLHSPFAASNVMSAHILGSQSHDHACLPSGIDSSATAVNLARKNEGQGSYTGQIEFICEEAEKFMSRAAKHNLLWDVVVLGKFLQSAE